MQCSICGTENSLRVKFCAECGSPIGVPCPECGFRNAGEATVCGGCGQALNSAYNQVAERRQITVFFSDIVGSTALAERLDPEDLQDIYARYQALCAEAIRHYDGYLAQYLGDGVLAYFGYPTAREDAAGRAVRAGLEILARAEEIAIGGSRPSLRIGIHTGLVVVGDVGDGARRERLALGEAPNIAARIQSEALPDTIVTSDATRKLLAGQFALEELGSRTLKGLSRPMQIFRVLGESCSSSRFHAMKSADGLTRLVGREREMLAIGAAWADAAKGQGKSLLLRGKAGMGKSRLLEAARQIASGQLHELLEAQCSPYRMISPLHPIVEMIERRLGFEERMSAVDMLDLVEQFTAGRGVKVEEASAVLAGLLSVPTFDRYPEIDLPPAKRMQFSIGILADLLLHSVSGSPVLLLIEDLHWADPSTLDLLAEMAARLPSLSVLMLCTTRQEFPLAWQGLPNCAEISVGTLTPDDARALIASIADPKLLPLVLVQEIAARTAGVPLFTEAVTRTVMNSGLLRELEDRYELTGPIPSGLIPATVQDSLMARIDRLGADRPVAQLAATVGRESSFELLQAVLRTPAASLAAALRRMVELELVSEEGTPPDATYTFRHALIQDTAYESLLRKTRQEFHEKIAEALMQRFPAMAETKPELLARHHEGAGHIAEATVGWMKAGQQARQRLALRECGAYLRKAISLLETLPEDDPARLQSEMEAQLALGQVLSETLGWASREVEAAFNRARGLCTKLDNHIGLFLALNGLSAVFVLRGQLHEALETAGPVWKLAKVIGEPVFMLSAAILNCIPYYFMGRFAEAQGFAEEVLPLYTVDRERMCVATMHLPCSFACAHMRALCLWCTGYPEQAEQQWAQAWTNIEELNIPEATTFALGYMLHRHWTCRNREAVARGAGPAYEGAADGGFLFWSSQARVFRGWAQAMNGEVEPGITEMKMGLENYRLIGSGLNSCGFSLMMAEAQLAAGRHEEALSAVAAGLKHASGSDERATEAESYRVQGMIHLAQGDVAAAETSLARAVDIARAQHAKMYEVRAATMLGVLLRDSGRVDEASELLQPLYSWFQEGHDTLELKKLRATIESMGMPADASQAQ